jgi:multidrug efflux pump
VARRRDHIRQRRQRARRRGRQVREYGMPNFFIDRPIFAWVVAILISLGGVLSILNLGVQSYPSIAPPQVNIRAKYPGANAQTTEKTVTQVIEQQLTGIDNLL